MSSRPVRTLAAAATATLALVSLAACNDDDSGSAGSSSSAGSAASSPTSASSSTATDSTAPTPSDTGSGSSGGPQVTVLDAGNDPKEQLLLDVPEGQVETSTIDMKIGTSLGGAGTTTIPLAMTYVTTVKDVTDDQITASFEFKDVEAHLPASAGAEAQNQIDQAFKSIEGLNGTIELTPSGAVTSSHFHLPADAPPELSSTIDQLANQTSQVAVPFPTEPVGEGAKWQVETQLGASGVTTDQTATYTLDSLDGDDYSISVQIDQQVGSSSTGADVKGKNSLTGSYDGTLTSFAATSGSIKGGGTSTVSVGGQTLNTKTTIDMHISTDVQ